MAELEVVSWFDVTAIDNPDNPIEVCLDCASQVTDPQMVVAYKEVSRSDMDETMTLCCNVCESVIFKGREDDG